MTMFRFVSFLLFCPGCLSVPARVSSWKGIPQVYPNHTLVSACADTTSVRENPWTAILFYDKQFRCGATILEDDIAITAAHCVISKRNDFFRLYYGRNIQPNVGIPDRGADKYGGDTEIEAIRIHPNYDLNNKYEGSDIAILKLKKKIHFNQLVKPIEVIPTKSKYTKMLKRGAYVQVAGFGQTSGPVSGATKKDYPTHMQMIIQRVVPHQQCNRGTGIGPARDVLCTRGKCGKGSNSTSIYKQICPGDSGSGIVGFFQEENKYYLLAVVSYIITPNQEDCGKSSKPAFSIITRNHRDFIDTPIHPPFPPEPRHCIWAAWAEWTNCHKREPNSCEGVRTRTRSVSREAEHGGKPCKGEYTQEAKCTPGHFAPVDGFEVAIPQIDKTCRAGEACKKKEYCPDVAQKYCQIEGLEKSDETRKKIIKQLKGAVCNKKEKAFCCKGEKERNEPSILFLGREAVEDWSPWSAWTACSSTCGGGVQGRTRQCARSNPYDCPKQFQQDTRNCNSKPCHNESSSDTICKTVTEKIPKPTTISPDPTSTTEYSRIRIKSHTSFTFTKKIICRDRK